MVFYRWPNDGSITLTSKEDEKIVCYCGKANPRAPREVQKREQVDPQIAVHFIRYLKKATRREYFAKARRERKIQECRSAWSLV